MEATELNEILSYLKEITINPYRLSWTLIKKSEIKIFRAIKSEFSSTKFYLIYMRKNTFKKVKEMEEGMGSKIFHLYKSEYTLSVNSSWKGKNTTVTECLW